MGVKTLFEMVMRRSTLKTLLVVTVRGGALGLLPDFDALNPGERSLSLGTPGLSYAAPLGLE